MYTHIYYNPVEHYINEGDVLVVIVW